MKRHVMLRAVVGLVAVASLAAGLGTARGQSVYDIKPPPLAQLKICKGQASQIAIPTFSWGNWDGKELPFEISGDDLIKLGDEFQTGIGRFTRSSDIARKLFEYAALKWPRVSAVARLRVAQATIEDVQSSREERERSIGIMKAEAERGVTQAFYSFGRAYEMGRLGEPDYAKAVDFYERGAVSGNPWSLVALAGLYKAGRKPEVGPLAADATARAAMTRLYQEIGDGNCIAIFHIASLYTTGEAVPRNPKLAALWYHAGLDAGLKKAAEFLADFYWTGFGVPQSNELSLKYVTIAAEGSIPSAMLNLGRAHASGRFGAQNRASAAHWLEKAIAGGQPEAFKALVSMYMAEFGGDKDEPKAIQYLERMIKRSIATPSDVYLAGHLYIFGSAEIRNQKRGINLLESAAGDREGRAAMDLGDIYFKGFVGAPEPARAIRYYRQAASLGNVDAMSALTALFACGQVVTISPEISARWFNVAAYAGSASKLKEIANDRFARDAVAGAAERAQLLRFAALNGDRDAMIALAYLFETGGGVAKDIKARDFWLERAVGPGDSRSVGYLALAKAILDGRFPDQRAQTARIHLEKAAALQNPRALLELGRYLGKHSLAPVETVKGHIARAASLGSEDAMFQLSLMMGQSERIGDRTKDEWIVEAARLGSVSALIQLAKQEPSAEAIEAKLDKLSERFACGVTNLTELANAYAEKPGPANPEKALRLLLLAEKSVLMSAADLETLGMAYLRGYGDKSDPAKAEALLKRAALFGNERARRNLAIAWVHGLIRSMTRDEAVGILKAAAKQGNVEAAVELVGFLTSESSEPTLDAVQSAEIVAILRPIAGGSFEASRMLALLSLKRKIAGIPDAEAWAMLKKGALAGDLVSMREVAHFYVRGGVVERNAKEFFRWMLAAADRGDRDAMYEISAAYETGFGTAANMAVAERWRESAKRSGVEFATTTSPLEGTLRQ